MLTSKTKLIQAKIPSLIYMIMVYIDNNDNNNVTFNINKYNYSLSPIDDLDLRKLIH